MKLFDAENRKYTNKTISRLTQSSFSLSWDIEKEINWDQDVVIPNGISKDMYVDMISQLFYTEELVIHLASKLITMIPDFHAKKYLTTQLFDETRHAMAYQKYIEKIDKISPINPKLHDIFKFVIDYKGHYSGLIVALNVMMEGEAVGQQKLRIETLPCPIFKEINSHIIVDEARHAAFGIAYMKDILPTVSTKEKASIKKWIFQIWELWDIANKDRYEVDGAKILKTTQKDLDQRYKDLIRRLSDIGLEV